MTFTRTGIILCTENYAECISLYPETLGLALLFALGDANSKLTCCDPNGNCRSLRGEKIFGV